MSKSILPGERGLDYAFARPPGAFIRSLGYTFVVRYISPSTTNPKNLTIAERDNLQAAGVKILLVWESYATRPNTGAPGGRTDGTQARNYAFSLGYPGYVPILVAVDTDTYSGNIAAHEAYIRAFHEAVKPYSIGVYGDADILLKVPDICGVGWLPNASAWSSAKRAQALELGLIDVLQRSQTTLYGPDGKTYVVDKNDCIQPIIAWDPDPEPPPTPPTSPLPAELIGGSDMPARFVTKEVSSPKRYLWNGFVIHDVLDEEEALRLIDNGLADRESYVTPKVLPPHVFDRYRQV